MRVIGPRDRWRWLTAALLVVGVLGTSLWVRRVSHDVQSIADSRPVTTTFMRSRASAMGESAPARARWTALSAMPSYVPCAVVKAEDRAFFRHAGFDGGQLWRAISGAATGARRMGGSTISQQLARNLFLSDERTVRRKVAEAVYTVEMERVLDKRAILEAYLNLIEWGPGVWGIDAAARHYFGIPAESLSVSQATFLAGIIPNPRAVRPDDPRLRRVERRVLWQLGSSGFISPAELQSASASLGLGRPLVGVTEVTDAWPASVDESILADCGLARELERERRAAGRGQRADVAGQAGAAEVVSRAARVTLGAVVDSYEHGDAYARVYIYPGATIRLDSLRGDSVHTVVDGVIPLWLPASVLAEAGPPPTVALPVAYRPAASTLASAGDSSMAAAAMVHVTLGAPPTIVVVRERASGYVVRALGAGPFSRAESRGEAVPGVRLETRSVGGDVEATIDVDGGLLGYELAPTATGVALRLRRLAEPRRALRVLVDPGHPPRGATGPTGVAEATVTLAIARHLRDELQRAGMTVVVSREDDVPLSLASRVGMARRVGADVVVSIHADAAPAGEDPGLHTGPRTLFLHAAALPLATAVQRALGRTLGLRSRGVVRRSLAMTDIGGAAAILCEVAELTDAHEEQLLTQPEFQRAAARAIASGVRAFADQLGTRKAP
jgi:monofunctional biosynthetic peptidoglycan transglycosylase